MTKRARPTERRTGAGDRRGIVEKLLFSFMGPAQLGRNQAREGYVVDDAANRCDRCGQPWDVHERVSTSNMTYTRCPPPQR
jgi:hypothetical protein